MIELFDYQLKAYEKLKDIDKGFLFMGVGTGKTYTALNILMKKGCKNILIFTTAKDNKSGKWQSEARKMGFNGHLETYSYELGRVPKRAQNLVLRASKGDYDGLIVDEIHKVKKNWRTGKDSKLIYNLSKRIKYCIGLTGTHASNNYVDTFNMMRNLNANPFPTDNENEFVESYYKYKQIPTAYGTKKIPTKLQDYAKDTVMRLIDSKAYKYFPEDMDHTIEYIEVLGELDETYKKVESAIIEDEFGYEDTLNVLQKTNYLQQLSNGFYYDENEEPVFIEDNKIKELEKLLQKVDKEKTIIVYKFKEDLNRISKVAPGIPVLQTSQSEALNLQHLDTMIFYSPSFSYKDFIQMKGRIMRVGQKSKPRFILMCRKGTIEEYIYKVLENKGQASDLYKYFEEGRSTNSKPVKKIKLPPR